MKNVTPPRERKAPRTTPAGRRGASIVAGIALLPLVLVGLAVIGIFLAVGLIWAAAWAFIIAVAGAFIVAGLAAGVAVIRAQQNQPGPPR